MGKLILAGLLVSFFARAEILTPQQIQLLSNDSVIRLAIVDNDQIAGTGSAFSVNEQQGIFVTNYHVAVDSITKGKQLKALQSMSPKKWHSATVLSYSTKQDLAIIKVENWHKKALVLGDDKTVHKSSKMYSIGFPGNADITQVSYANDFVESKVTDGVISAPRTLTHNGGPVKHFQHNVTINAGNSGGPLINLCGELIGVNVLGATEGQGVFFAITVNELKAELKRANIIFERSSKPCKNIINTPLQKWLDFIIPLVVFALLVLLLLYFRLAKKAQSGAHINSAFIERLVRSKVQKMQQLPVSENAKSNEKTLAIEVINNDKNSNKKYQLPVNKQIIIGRAKNETHICIDNPYLSKQHAALLFKQNKLFVKDLNSKNRTSIDNKIVDNQWVEMTTGQSAMLANKITIKTVL